MPCPLCSPAILRRQARANADKDIKALAQNFIFANMVNLPYDPELSFELYPAIADQRAKALALSFTSGDTRELLLSGPPGRGKSGLAKSAVYALQEQGVQVVWLPVAGYMTLCKWDMDEKKMETNIRQIAKRVEVLVLDDLGVEGATEYTIRELIELLEYRHENGLRTFITSNYTIKMLAVYWKIDKYAGIPGPGDRLLDRVRGWYTKHEIPATMPSMRN